MDLKKFFGKEVSIQASNGLLFCGIINDYLFPEDNNRGIESIILETYSGDLIEFSNFDIISISIINSTEH